MDIGTAIGIIAGLVFVFLAIEHDGGSIRSFVDVAGALVAFGGSFSALFVMYPAKQVFGIFGVVKNCFFFKLATPKQEIARLSELATIARRDGLLALEKKIPEIKDPFLVRGLEMVIDGAPREKLDEVLRIELSCIQERHAIGKKIFDQLGASLPAFAMVGTLVGLILMLNQLDDPTKIGSGMAVAMVATFYGAFGANLVFLPMAGKLEYRNKQETLLRELMIQGLICLVEGEAPRGLEAKLKAFLTPKVRAGMTRAAA